MNPWGTVGGMPDVDIMWSTDEELLQGGDAWWYPDRRLIVMKSGLRQVSRRCALAHELAHIVHGDRPCATSWHDSVQERAADRTAARWLMPIDRFADVVRWAASPGEAAGELWVTLHLFNVRCDSLHPAERHYLRRALEAKDEAP